MRGKIFWDPWETGEGAGGGGDWLLSDVCNFTAFLVHQEGVAGRWVRCLGGNGETGGAGSGVTYTLHTHPTYPVCGTPKVRGGEGVRYTERLK